MAIAHMMRENASITHVGLENNRMGSAGATAIAEMLDCNITLKDLNLDGNEFSDKVSNQ